MVELKTEHLFDFYMKFEKPIVIGDGPEGHRIVSVTREGEFTGPKLRGTFGLGTVDWPRLRSDGVLELDVHCTLKTHDDAYIYMKYVGLVVAKSPELMNDIIGYASGTRKERVEHSAYRQRSAVFFETGDARYSWLNGIIAVGTGGMEQAGVSYSIHAVV
jgi:Protein of unknown function (DUF3237)